MKDEKGLKYSALTLCGFLFMVYGIQVFFNLELAYRPGVELRRFFTSFFAHSSLEHLLNNLFFLGLFGTVYEIHTDSKTFFLTFLISAVLAKASVCGSYSVSSLSNQLKVGIGILMVINFVDILISQLSGKTFTCVYYTYTIDLSTTALLQILFFKNNF